MLSKNEVERLKSLRGKLAVLCPETDGLQAKHRLKRTLTGKTRKERVEEMISILEKELKFSEAHTTKREARIISQVYDFIGFTSEEVYLLLKNEYFKNFR